MRFSATQTWMVAASLGLLGLVAQPLAQSSRSAQSSGSAEQGRAEGARRLVDSIEAPYAYVVLDGRSDPKSRNRDGGSVDGGAVGRLLSDPSLDALFAGSRGASNAGASSEAEASSAGGTSAGGASAGGGGANGAGEASSGSAAALSLVRGMLRRGASELELAMTGIVATEPGVAGQPLLVLRARLRRDEADRLRIVLSKTTELATPSRKIGSHQTYRIRSARGGDARRPGELVEMAMVGDDLVVGNDDTALREVLEPLSKRTTASKRRVLSNDPRYQDLRKRLEIPAGSLVAYGDWQRLGRRLQSTLTGVPAQLLGSSGLGSARSVMMAIAPARKGSAKKGFAATLLLDFEFEARGFDARGAAAGMVGGAGVGIDGWFAATEPMSAKKLLRELPRGGLGGLVLSVDLAAVASHSPRSSHMVWDLRDAYTGFGLDFERNVLGRLVSRGTVQLHFGQTDADSEAIVTPVYSLRAKSRTAAEDLFDDLRRVVESTEFGSFEVVKDAKGKIEVLHLHGAAHQMSAFVCVHNDSVLLAESRETLVQVQQELRRSKPRGGRDQLAGAAIKSIGGESVAGLFDLDLDPLFQGFASALPGADLSALPKRHIGYLDTGRRNDGAVVRIRVLSSR